MTLDDLIKEVLDILPEATVGEDNEGQLIVYTNLYVDKDGQIQSFDAALEPLLID